MLSLYDISYDLPGAYLSRRLTSGGYSDGDEGLLSKEGVSRC